MNLCTFIGSEGTGYVSCRGLNHVQIPEGEQGVDVSVFPRSGEPHTVRSWGPLSIAHSMLIGLAELRVMGTITMSSNQFLHDPVAL